MGLFFLVLDRGGHHTTQPDARVPAGPAAAALPGPLTAALGLSLTAACRLPSLEAALEGSSSGSATTAGRTVPGHGRSPVTHLLGKPTAIEHFAVRDPGGGMGPSEPGLVGLLSKYLPVFCSLRSSIQCRPRPQPPSPLAPGPEGVRPRPLEGDPQSRCPASSLPLS